MTRVSTVHERRTSSLLIRVHKQTLDVYEREFPGEPATMKFWMDLEHLEKRLLAVTRKKASAVELKAAEMAYNRGLKRICHG